MDINLVVFHGVSLSHSHTHVLARIHCVPLLCWCYSCCCLSLACYCFENFKQTKSYTQKKIIRNAEISINHHHQHCKISCVSIHFEVCVSIFSWTAFILSISYSHQYRILVVVQVYPLSIFCVSQLNKKRSLDFLFFSPSK